MERKIQPTEEDWKVLMAVDPIKKLSPLAAIELANIVLTRMLDEAEAKLVQANGHSNERAAAAALES